MARLVLHKLAELDFARAFDWYAERSIRAALAFDEAVHDAVARIAADPAAQPRLDKRHQYCLLQRFPYLVVYRSLEDAAVVVVAIAHGRRQAYWKRRR